MVAKKKTTAAKRSAAEEGAAEQDPAKKAAAGKSPAKKTGAKKTAAKAVAKKSTAKSTAQKSTAKKVGAAEAAEQTGATTVVAKKTPGTATAAKTAVPKARMPRGPRRPRGPPRRGTLDPAGGRGARGELQSEADRLRTEIDSSERSLQGMMRDSGDGAGDDEADTGSKNILTLQDGVPLGTGRLLHGAAAAATNCDGDPAVAPWAGSRAPPRPSAWASGPRSSAPSMTRHARVDTPPGTWTRIPTPWDYQRPGHQGLRTRVPGRRDSAPRDAASPVAGRRTGW
ncbi:hypothetical protein SVIOM342S_06393 [Streptomyces violaceorubidus]